jgi:hypothetical protein
MDKKRLQTLVLVAALSLTPAAALAEKVDEKPSGYTMMGDLLVARPVGIAMFAVGSVTFVATLPFSLLGGNAMEAGKTLVLDPAKETFVRCLGCVRPGRKERIKD